jgi:hypothetical protein
MSNNSRRDMRASDKTPGSFSAACNLGEEMIWDSIGTRVSYRLGAMPRLAPREVRTSKGQCPWRSGPPALRHV